MAGRSGINKREIAKLTRGLEREFTKNPIRVPLQADPSGLSLPPATTVNNYNGPVVTVNGDQTQIAWGNDEVHQTQDRVEQIAPGYEELARLITDLLANLPAYGLDEADAADVRSNAAAVLGEVTKGEPDKGVVKSGVTMLKGILASIATGVSKVVTDESAQLARETIDGLGNVLPF